MIYKAMVGERSIITIIADNKRQAVEIVSRELLKNPSRRTYYDAWVNAGKVVKKQ